MPGAFTSAGPIAHGPPFEFLNYDRAGNCAQPLRHSHPLTGAFHLCSYRKKNAAMRPAIPLYTLLLLPLGLCGQNALPPPCDQDAATRLATRARTALSGGDPIMAATLFRQAHEACPSQAGLQLELARALTAGRRFDEAIAAANDHLKHDPSSVPGMLALANALFMAQRWEDSRSVLDRVLEIDPDNPTALLIQGNNFYFLGDSGQAEQVLLKLLEKHPEDADAAYALGRIYYMDGRAEYAMGQF